MFIWALVHGAAPRSSGRSSRLSAYCFVAGVIGSWSLTPSFFVDAPGRHGAPQPSWQELGGDRLLRAVSERWSRCFATATGIERVGPVQAACSPTSCRCSAAVRDAIPRRAPGWQHCRGMALILTGDPAGLRRAAVAVPSALTQRHRALAEARSSAVSSKPRSRLLETPWPTIDAAESSRRASPARRTARCCAPSASATAISTSRSSASPTATAR